MSDTVTAQEVHVVLRAQLADALYCHASEIENDINFQDLGLDSVLSAELSVVINSHFGLSEKANMLYRHPTLTQLAAYVAEQTNDLRDAS